MTESSYFDAYASLYDELQPILIENYRAYHALALDFIPGNSRSALRILDLGCGTGTFLDTVVALRPNSSALALDNSSEMLEKAKLKPALGGSNVETRQWDLGCGLPEGIGEFDLVLAFSAIHHLDSPTKQNIIRQIYECLVPGGWFFLVDAMFDQFDDDVFRLGRERESSQRAKRVSESAVSQARVEKYEELKRQISENSPERDRIGTRQEHVDWLQAVGFSTIDHIWHLWFEHFFIARK